MGANKPIREHWIPEMLLYNFCDDEGFLWAADKCGQQPFHPPPSKLFVEKYLYATTDYAQSVRTFENEDALAKIEDKAAPVISAIIEQARLGNPPRLSPEDNEHFKRFIAAQVRRTPEFQEHIGLQAKADQAFHAAATKLADDLGYTIPDEFWSQPTYVDWIQTFKANLPGNYAAGLHPVLEQHTKQFCRDYGWLVAAIDLPKRSFVIGSHGITNIERHGEGESWLPIAYDVAIKLTGFPDEGYFLRLDRTNESIIKTVNRSTVEGSRFIAGRSKTLIESLMGGYWKKNGTATGTS